MFCIYYIESGNNFMCKTVLAFGSNLGNRLENLKTAIELVNKLPRTKVLKISNIYESEPADVLEKQNLYLNCCASITTELGPHALLNSCFKIETLLGRKRLYKNSPRTIDIDIILYDILNINDKNLTIPHPSWKIRDFVMVPMLDLYENKTPEKLNIEKLLKNLKKKYIARIFSKEKFA